VPLPAILAVVAAAFGGLNLCKQSLLMFDQIVSYASHDLRTADIDGTTGSAPSGNDDAMMAAFPLK
jgi:hypothetical protein